MPIDSDENLLGGWPDAGTNQARRYPRRASWSLSSQPESDGRAVALARNASMLPLPSRIRPRRAAERKAIEIRQVARYYPHDQLSPLLLPPPPDKWLI